MFGYVLNFQITKNIINCLRDALIRQISTTCMLIPPDNKPNHKPDILISFERSIVTLVTVQCVQNTTHVLFGGVSSPFLTKPVNYAYSPPLKLAAFTRYQSPKTPNHGRRTQHPGNRGQLKLLFGRTASGMRLQLLQPQGHPPPLRGPHFHVLPRLR